jgi:hypothetical protein
MPPLSYDLNVSLILPSASDGGRMRSTNRRTARVLSRRMEVSRVTREQLLRAAAQRAIDKVEAASGGRDEQAMFEALGECLTWICALDRFFEPRADYRSRRNSDRQGEGQLLLGLRHARNTILHGDAVVGVAESTDVPHPQVITNGRGRHSRIVGPPTIVRWTFDQTFPTPTKPAPHLEPVYAAHIAGSEVSTTIGSAISWLDRELATPTMAR